MLLSCGIDWDITILPQNGLKRVANNCRWFATRGDKATLSPGST